MKIKTDVFLMNFGLIFIILGVINFKIISFFYNRISDNIVYVVFIIGYLIIITGVLIGYKKENPIK
jgi:hypothetical protein